MDESLELARLVVIASVIEHNLRTRNRLTVCSIHHHIAMPVIRQLLDHHRQITDIEEQTLRSDAGIVRSHLHQIGAQRQIATDFDGILHLFVIRTTIIAFAEILLVQLRGLLQEHLIGSLILDIIFIIRRDVETGNDHLQILEIAYIQMHPLPFRRAKHQWHILHLEHRLGESFLRISQHIHSRPSAPSIQCIIDIVELIQRFGIRSLLHETEVLHGKFASLRNILIDVDERVDGIQILRLSDLSYIILTVFLNELVGTETSRPPISHLIIIGVHQQIRLLAVSLETDEMQQIVVERTAVHTLQRQRHIPGRSIPGKKLRLLQGFLEELLALLPIHLQPILIRGSILHLYPVRMIPIHLAEHGISHSLQHGGFCIQSFRLHPLHVRCQRVCRNLFPENHLPHLCRQQLAVVFRRRSLGDDLLHHPNLALGLILLSDDISLLPQVVVGLSRCLQHGKHGYEECYNVSFHKPTVYYVNR